MREEGREEVLAALAEDSLNLRHVYGALDTSFPTLRPREKAHELHLLDHFPVLVWTEEQVACVWAAPSEAEAEALADFISTREINELRILGDAAFCVLRPRLTDGAWRCSHNYGVTALQFRPRPSEAVRRLISDDRRALEQGYEKESAFREFLDYGRSALFRDFDWMASGDPVFCYGGFARDELVGFCSTVPICRGVREISLLVVTEEHRRKGTASGLLTAAARDAFAQGEAVGYHAGGAGEHLRAMLQKIGFHELRKTYRYVPPTTGEPWRTGWWLVV